MGKKGNVLLVGVSGSGKSTLINGFVDRKVARVLKGDSVTQEISKYSSDLLDFSMYDTRGFEFNFFNQAKTIKDMQKLIKCGLDESDDVEESSVIGTIWYCVDSIGGRLEKKNLTNLKKIVKRMKDVPVIVVLTKAIEDTKREENAEMVKKQFAQYASTVDLKGVVSVIAEPYSVNQGTIIPQYGIEELKELTDEVLGNYSTDEAKEKFRNAQRTMKGQLYVQVAAASAAVACAVPVPIADGVMLTGIETTMLTALAQNYDIAEDLKPEVVKAIVSSGIVGAGAKTIVGGLKAIPGIGQTFGIVVNMVVGGVIVEILGEATIALFEENAKGKIELSKFDDVIKFIKQFMEDHMPEVMEKLNKWIEEKLNDDNKEGLKEKALSALRSIFQNNNAKTKKIKG